MNPPAAHRQPRRSAPPRASQWEPSWPVGLLDPAHPGPTPVKFFGVGDPLLPCASSFTEPPPSSAPLRTHQSSFTELQQASPLPPVKPYTHVTPAPVLLHSLSEKLDKGRAGVGCPIRPQGLTPRASACADPLPRQEPSNSCSPSLCDCPPCLGRSPLTPAPPASAFVPLFPASAILLVLSPHHLLLVLPSPENLTAASLPSEQPGWGNRVKDRQRFPTRAKHHGIIQGYDH
jgi:hypothetical protein